jgi:cell division initiation protein
MPQAPTPEDIRKTTFHTTMRGYARDEVDEYLTAIARVVASLTEKAETGYLNLGVKMGELLQEAKDAADELLAAAHTDVATLVQEAKTSAQNLEASARSQAADTLQTAETHAAKIVQEAEQRVAELTDEENAVRRELTSLRSQLESITERLRPLVLSSPPPPPEDADENGHQERSIVLEQVPHSMGLGTE